MEEFFWISFSTLENQDEPSTKNTPPPPDQPSSPRPRIPARATFSTEKQKRQRKNHKDFFAALFSRNFSRPQWAENNANPRIAPVTRFNSRARAARDPSPPLIWYNIIMFQFTRPRGARQRSKFDRSHEYKTTFNAGYLIPFFVDEYLPGDTFILDFSFLVRMATPIYPIMDSVFLDTFFFSVPCRLLWEHWENMMGERDNPDDSIDYIVPVIRTDTSSYITPLSIYDYFGLPVNVTFQFTRPRGARHAQRRTAYQPRSFNSRARAGRDDISR